MAGVFPVAFFVHRPQDTLNSVAVAAFVILVSHPPALFAASFQLSFAAVASIIFGLSILPKSSPSAERKSVRTILLQRMGTFMLVSLSAIIGTLPLALFYFNGTSLIGILSNLVFIPVIGFGVVPPGLASVLLFLVHPAVAAYGFQLCGLILSGALHLVRWAASLPFAAITTVTPSLVEIFLYYCLLGAIWGALRQFARRGGSSQPEGKRSGALRFSLILAGVAVAGFLLDGLYWGYQRFWTDKMKVTLIDVGHGNASLIEVPGGEVVLIDGGGFSDNSVYDVGQRIVAPLLWRKKIRTV
jgi:competence protein ComEC